MNVITDSSGIPNETLISIDRDILESSFARCRALPSDAPSPAYEESDQSLRCRLDGILSILRYFVTVRRATG